MSLFTRSIKIVALAGLFALAVGNVSAQVVAEDRATCDRAYKPQVGQQGKDVIWVPTPDEVVQRMLQVAKVTPKDIVYDLGAGDGKIAIAAGKLGATSVGIEYNPDMAKLAQCYVQAEKLTGKTRIVQGDVFESDFRDATVVTMYLLPELNVRLLPKLLKDLKPGTRIVSHAFQMGTWEPEQTLDVGGRADLLLDHSRAWHSVICGCDGCKPSEPVRGRSCDVFPHALLAFPFRAASIVATSIFLICIIASNARFATSPPLAIASVRTRGVICHDRPHLSLHQPHALSCAAVADDRVPVAVGLGLVVGRDLERERLAVLELRPAVEADAGHAQTVNSTVSTSPFFPPGKSDGARCTAPTVLSGNVAA